jgi:hypothetical protein
MTLDEAIKYAEEVAEKNEWFDKNCLESIQCRKCAEEYRQLAEWLKDYKRLREQTSWIPISEHPPELESHVLVSLDDKYVTDDYYGLYGANDFDAFKDGAVEEKVVAWMPLPEPYKAESEGG